MKYSKLILHVLNVLLTFIIVLSITSCSNETQNPKYVPGQGYVQNEETAIKIAVAVWIPIYGKEQIENEKPYQATLKVDIWYVTGSLPKGWIRGVAEAEIAKNDGRILKITHGK